MATTGKIHNAVKLGLVLDASHPAQRQADYLRIDPSSTSEGYAVYAIYVFF